MISAPSNPLPEIDEAGYASLIVTPTRPILSLNQPHHNHAQLTSSTACPDLLRNATSENPYINQKEGIDNQDNGENSRSLTYAKVDWERKHNSKNLEESLSIGREESDLKDEKFNSNFALALQGLEESEHIGVSTC